MKRKQGRERLRGRSWLTVTVVLAAGLLGSCDTEQAMNQGAAQEGHNAMRQDVWAVQLYTVRAAMEADAPGTLAKVRAAGYPYVELAGFYGRTAAEFGALLAAADLQAVSAHVPMPTPENIAQLAADARTLGYTWIVTGTGPQGVESAEALAKTIAQFRAGARLAAEHGLQLAIHNHWWEFDHEVDGVRPFEAILAAVPELAVELDVYWVAKGGADPVAVMDRWPQRIRLLHVKDGDLGERIVHKAVGQGRMPIADIVARARQLTPPPVALVVELDECDTDMMTAVRDSLAYLKTLDP